ncbi:transposable element Tcb1 transposase [Trichonephila clavipes]|nr:transposable element Tcb1 transposase [Trichonephila clavipes]
MQKRSDFSDVQKGMVSGFRAKGGSISGTAEFVNCSRAAMVKVYRAWQNRTVQNQRRGKCGAPRAIDDRGERRLRRCVRTDRRATVEHLTTKMNQGATKSVSQTTIQRTLLRLGLRSRRLVRAPMLTAVHRRRRLEFARQRETSERNHPATIAGTVQAGGGSIMVWGMFSWHSLGSLIIVEGTMDQYKYASVLADHVHTYMRIVFPQDDGIFQQDNARCHTAASVRAWFEEHQDEFTVLPWPANSPELNPIENLWDHLDRVVRAMDPQPRNLAQLATALESTWLNIPENTFRDLSDSLPTRLAAVRTAKGGYSGLCQMVTLISTVKSLNDVRSQVKSAYQSNSAITDIDVTFDGTWLTQGHSSQIDVGCMIDLLTGFVMDFGIMSKRCIECNTQNLDHLVTWNKRLLLNYGKRSEDSGFRHDTIVRWRCKNISIFKY